MYHQQQQNQSRPKMEGSKRVQKVLDELSVKYADRKHGAQPIVMEDKAKQMLMDYASELSISVLEAASMLATHRNSKTIDVEDINMILKKKLGVDLTAFTNARLQQQALQQNQAQQQAVPVGGQQMVAQPMLGQQQQMHRQQQMPGQQQKLIGQQQQLIGQQQQMMGQQQQRPGQQQQQMTGQQQQMMGQQQQIIGQQQQRPGQQQQMPGQHQQMMGQQQQVHGQHVHALPTAGHQGVHQFGQQVGQQSDALREAEVKVEPTDQSTAIAQPSTSIQNSGSDQQQA